MIKDFDASKNIVTDETPPWRMMSFEDLKNSIEEDLTTLEDCPSVDDDAPTRGSSWRKDASKDGTSGDSYKAS